MMSDGKIILYNYGDKPLTIKSIYIEGESIQFLLKVLENNMWTASNTIPSHSIGILYLNETGFSQILLSTDKGMVHIDIR